MATPMNFDAQAQRDMKVRETPPVLTAADSRAISREIKVNPTQHSPANFGNQWPLPPRVITLTLNGTDAVTGNQSGDTSMSWTLKNLPLLTKLRPGSVIQLSQVMLGSDDSSTGSVEIGITGFQTDSYTTSGSAQYNFDVNLTGTAANLRFTASMPPSVGLTDTTQLQNGLIKATIVQSTQSTLKFNSVTKLLFTIREPGSLAPIL